MPSFPFDEKFLPVVKYGDYVKFQGYRDFVGKTYKVIGVEPVQPFMIDILSISGALPSNVTSLAANGSTNDRTGDIPTPTMATILESDTNTFIQYRLGLLDDILLQLAAPGPKNPYYASAVANTYLQKPLPVHTVSKQLTTAPATDTLLWANSSNIDLAGGIAGQTPKRASRLIGLNVYSNGAGVISFGDAAAAGGTKAALSNPSQFQFNFSVAKDWVSLGRDQIPQDIIYQSGIVFQQDTANTTNITAVVEEDSYGAFSGTYIEEALARANHQSEFYVFEDKVPSFKAINPLAISQASARVVPSGWQFAVDEVSSTESEKYTVIPLTSIKHQGARIGARTG